MARLASDWVAALIGWDLNPLDSNSEFQARLYRRLSQRSRLNLARPTSDIGPLSLPSDLCPPTSDLRLSLPFCVLLPVPRAP